MHPGTLLVTYDRVQDEQLEVEDIPVTISRISEALGPENDCVINHQTRWKKLQSILESRDWSHLNPEQK